MQLLERSSSSVRSVCTGACPGANPVFMTLKHEYAWRAARDMNVTVGSMCRRTRGPEELSPRPMPVLGEVGEPGVGTKLAIAEEDGAPGARGDERMGESEGRRGGGVPGSGRTSMQT